MSPGNARSRTRTAYVLLALLCLRALVPAGFMLARSVDGVTVVLCSVAAAKHHQGHEHSGHNHAAVDPTCPYAQSAGPAPLPALPKLSVTPPDPSYAALRRDAQTIVQFGPLRRYASRAPPSNA